MLRGIDTVDARILELLQEDGRMQNIDLAKAAGVAPSTCLERVRRLSKEGFFLGVRAEVVPAKMGAGIEALVAVRLYRVTEAGVASFREAARGLAPVMMILHLAGPPDFLLHVAVKDTAHLQQTLGALAAREEVAGLDSSVVMGIERCPAPQYSVRRCLR